MQSAAQRALVHATSIVRAGFITRFRSSRTGNPSRLGAPRRRVAGAISAFVMTVFMLALAGSAWGALPDNRAYEMVSPIEKGGLSLLANFAVTDTAGEHVIVDGGSKNSLLSSGLSWMLETRSPKGWSGVQVGPPPTPGADYKHQSYVSFNAVSEDFSRFAFQTWMPLDPRHSNDGMGEYVSGTPGGPFAWATGPPAPAVPLSDPGECENGFEPYLCTTNRAVFAGASSDLGHVVWGEYHPLLAPPAALAGYPADTHEHGYEVYESVAGVDQLVGLVPTGPEAECGGSHGSCVVPPCGAAMGNEGGAEPGVGFATVAGSVSGDGSQVVFTSPDPVPYNESPGTPGCTPPEIYVRVNATTSVQVSASQKAGGDPSGPKEKVYAGSSEEHGHLDTVFFTSKEALTEDANTGPADEGNDLYAYTLATESQPAKLVDLTPQNNTPGPNATAEVTFLGASTDGALVYFTASSVLSGEANAQGQTAKPGVSNLYVRDTASGSTTFIAPGLGLRGLHKGLKYGEGVSVTVGQLTSQVTPNGEHLVFVSSERLTGYDNIGPECAGEDSNGVPVRHSAPCAEVYLYTAPTGELACVSCNPSGALPAGSARLPARPLEGYGDNGAEPGTSPRPLAVSDDGSRVFFSSPDRLTRDAPAPTNTIGEYAELAQNWEYEPNVYEYERGTLQLIAPAAALLTTTPSGRDVFLDTYGRLTPQDRDGSPDVYDARVNGGFPALAPPACSGTSCQGDPAVPPIFSTPPSVTFRGAGNVAPQPSASTPPKPKPKSCRRGFVRKKGKCARKRRTKRGLKSTRRGK